MTALGRKLSLEDASIRVRSHAAASLGYVSGRHAVLVERVPLIVKDRAKRLEVLRVRI